jgi:hypothetical protein
MFFFFSVFTQFRWQIYSTVQYKLYLQAASNIYRTNHEIYINSTENYVTVTQKTIKQQHEYCFKALAPTLFYTIITDKKHNMNE